MLTEWIRRWYTVQVKSFSIDKACPVEWDDVMGKLRLSGRKCMTGWLLWRLYYFLYAAAVIRRLVPKFWEEELQLRAIYFELAYFIFLVTLTLIMDIVTSRRRDLVVAMNSILKLDATMQRWSS